MKFLIYDLTAKYLNIVEIDVFINVFAFQWPMTKCIFIFQNQLTINDPHNNFVHQKRSNTISNSWKETHERTHEKLKTIICREFKSKWRKWAIVRSVFYAFFILRKVTLTLNLSVYLFAYEGRKEWKSVEKHLHTIHYHHFIPIAVSNFSFELFTGRLHY